jgi:methionine synthase II (cobalamin-independent)
MEPTNRILTTHVGSLVRPPGLIPFLEQIEDAAPYDKSAYDACLSESIADVVRRHAGIVGRDRVMAGSDCGFAQGPFTRRVHPTIQWAKLRAQAKGARIATAKLWGQSATS